MVGKDAAIGAGGAGSQGGHKRAGLPLKPRVTPGPPTTVRS